MENASVSNKERPGTGYAGAGYGEFVERVDELAQLWRLGADTEALDVRLRDLRACAERYFEQSMAGLGGLSDNVLLQYTREHEDMIRRIDTVLADFAAGGGAIHWLDMIDSIDRVRQRNYPDDSASFALQADPHEPADPLIPWSDDLRIGIDWMDQHHRTLIDAINEIAQLPPHYDVADADALLERLRRIAWHHFHEEEARLPPAAQAQKHVAQHRQLVGELDQLIFDVRSRRVDLAEAVNGRLSQWLIDHIKTADRDDFQSLLD